MDEDRWTAAARRLHRYWEGARERVRFSQHAEERLQRRGVTLTNTDAGKARQYDRRMREKGAREALIYMKDSTAMVVSVTNRTVITALDDVTAADSIFTNIDSQPLSEKAGPTGGF